MEVVLGDGQLARLTGKIPHGYIELLIPDPTVFTVMEYAPVRHPGAIELGRGVDYMYLRGFLDDVCPGQVELELIRSPEA